MSMKPARPRSHTLAVIAAALALSGAPSWAADSSAQIDDAARAAYSHPASGLAGLRALTEGGEGALRALAATAETEVLLALHELDALRQRIEQLRLDADLYVQAAADLAQARSLRAAGVLDGATRLAQSARARLMPAQGGAAADALRADACRLVGVLLGSSGEPEEGLRELDASRRLAKAAGDLRREALAMLDQSQIYTALRNPGAARDALEQAQRAAAGSRDAALNSRVQLARSRMALDTEQYAAARTAADMAFELARRDEMPLLQAHALLLRSQIDRITGQPKDALDDAKQAAALVEGRTLQHPLRRQAQAQLGLARIALGQVGAGRAEVESVIGTNTDPAQAGPLAAPLLRQLSDTLRTAGDVRGALDAYHRERALREAQLERDQRFALQELRVKYDSAAQARELELRTRDNAVKAAQIERHALQRWLMGLIALVLTLALASAVLLYRRVRSTRAQLHTRQRQLRELSQRDPLTGLANRRHFQQVVSQASARGEGFEGALFLLDIDHFKRINDEGGHARGDQVLMDVARKLAHIVRSDDLAVRWGGEEFLVLARGIGPAQIEPLARRMLEGVREVKVRLNDGDTEVTASIGYGLFPLGSQHAHLDWERALNLVDMALYLAKSQGRKRACGVASVRAGDDAALREIEADFERAWREGRVTLRFS
ncbi:MAG TPA: diguanylate cyclase [Burkholderiaceae bacterium]|nr:diguanylate cyclase [Burkholderiaceae bacterium]